jgi:hypothetical protein
MAEKDEYKVEIEKPDAGEWAAFWLSAGIIRPDYKATVTNPRTGAKTAATGKSADEAAKAALEKATK